MTIIQRFYLNEDERIIDKLDLVDNTNLVWWKNEPPKDETCLRECVFARRLSRLVDDLIIDTAPTTGLSKGEDNQALCFERYSLWAALCYAVGASHLNTIDIALSPQHTIAGELKREKVGWQASTSLSLFVDDVERCYAISTANLTVRQSTDPGRGAYDCQGVHKAFAQGPL